MDSLVATKFHQPRLLSLHNRRTILVKHISSLSLRNPSNPQNPKPIFDSLSLSLLKTTFIAAVATASLYFLRLNPAMAIPVSPPPKFEPDVFEEDFERDLDYHLTFNPNDVDALKSLLYVTLIKNKIDKAISLVDRLIGLEPEEVEWKYTKPNIYQDERDHESARVLYDLLIKEHPFSFDAYDGLISVSWPELNRTKALIEEGMRLAKKHNNTDAFWELRLLLAKVYVGEENYDEAFKVYNDLVKEKPRDFRPYACMGAIYTWLRKNSEANQCFERYKCYLPKEHEEDTYYHNIMVGAKLFVEQQDRA